jgi:serine protease AprX
MKYASLLLLLLISTTAFSQSKYYIYFKDKDAAQKGALNKTSSAYAAAEKELTVAAIERRKQVMGNNYITFEDLPVSQTYVTNLETLGIKIENKLKWFNAVTVYLNDSQLEKIKSLSFVDRIEGVKIFKNTDPVKENTPAPGQIGIDKTNSTNSFDYGFTLSQNTISDVPTVHDLGITGKGVYIGILDNGFNWKTVKAISSRNIIKEYDYVGKDSDVSNANGHGTAVFSMLGGYEPGKVMGPSFDSQFYLARTEDDAGESKAEEDNYAKALEDMEAAGVQIISSSLGYTEFNNSATSYSYKDMNGNTAISTKAVNLAFQRGIFLFASAGNDGAKAWHYISAPADAYNVMTVGSVNKYNTLSAFSSRGPTYDGRIKPEIVAMGEGNSYAETGGTYGSGSGTSYSCPIAAGIAGLLKSCWPHLTNMQMRKIFIESGDNTASPNNDRGYGLISAKKVIAYPNLQLVGSSYQLNKIFVNPGGVNSSTVKFNYKIGSGSFQSAAMNYDGTLKYNYTMPAASNGTAAEFYFEFNNTVGIAVREPASTNYKFSYGSLLIDNNIITDIKSNPVIPAEFSLSQNYPNPFNPTTTLNYSVPNVETGHASSLLQHIILKVYDLLGREITTLVNEQKSPGIYQVTFNGAGLPSGIYFYTLNAGGFVQTKKMLLMK